MSFFTMIFERKSNHINMSHIWVMCDDLKCNNCKQFFLLFSQLFWVLGFNFNKNKNLFHGKMLFWKWSDLTISETFLDDIF